MTSTQYIELLKDPRWQKKRLEILQRDGWACQGCFDTESTLVVHHKRYLDAVNPWDYPDDLLITLCETCHEDEREERPGIEGDLLGILRQLFLAPDLHDFVSGLMQLTPQEAPALVASAYSWAFSNPEIQTLILNKWHTSLRYKTLAGVKCQKATA